MLVKFLNHGTGSGRSAVEYLLGELDHKQQRRAVVKELRNDPIPVGHVIDSLDFKHRYSSIVLAWQKIEKPSRKQINQVLDLFELTAFSGLARRRFASCAILHGDDEGGQHVHILVARVDSLTGKSFNPAPPGWQPTFDALRDYFNFLYGWANPDMPSAVSYADHRWKTLKHVEFEQKVRTSMLDQIRAGRIANRGQLLEALNDFGKVGWQDHRYIKILPPGFEKPIALNGAMFNKYCDFEMIARSPSVEQSSSDGRTMIDLVRAGAALEELKHRISARAKFNFSRYCKKNSDLQVSVEQELLKFSTLLREKALSTTPQTDRSSLSGVADYPSGTFGDRLRKWDKFDDETVLPSPPIMIKQTVDKLSDDLDGPSEG